MKKLCIVIADYYKDVSKMLLDGATSEKVKDRCDLVIKKVYHVPGVFEIPVTISKHINKYDCFVALGCVIKGETPHFDLISKAVVNAIMDLSVKSKKPIGNGIITCFNMKQAIERANPEGKDIGGNAVSAVNRALANFK
tara:strand:+ start:321 stop:737 length:417 start_codon:yes stop_codon:yes gene_type:complete